MIRPEDLLVDLIRRDRAVACDAKVQDVQASLYVEDLAGRRVILEGWVEFEKAGHFEGTYVLSGLWAGYGGYKNVTGEGR